MAATATSSQGSTGLNAMLAELGSGGAGAAAPRSYEGQADCAKAIHAMLDEGRRPAPKPRAKFSVDAFVELRPHLSGYFSPPVELPVVVDADEDVFGCKWDDERRSLVIDADMPVAAPRTATEVCSAAQYAALARDDREPADGRRAMLYRIAAQYCAWDYACRYLSEAERAQVAGGSAMEDDRELLRAWPGLTAAERVQRAADGVARWADPDEEVQLLSPISCLLSPAAALLPAGDPTARPLVPAAYDNMEAARQRLLRAAVDGGLDGAARAQQASLRKRLARFWPDEAPPPPAPPPAALPGAVALYFDGAAAAAAAAALRADPSELRGAALEALLWLEAAVYDVQRMHTGSVSR